MARTTRNHGFIAGENEVSWANREGRYQYAKLIERFETEDEVIWRYRGMTAEELEAEKEEARKDFKTFNRDGKWNETGRNTGFKKEAAKYTRNRNKRFCAKVLRGEDFDNDEMPIRKESKQFVWNWW